MIAVAAHGSAYLRYDKPFPRGNSTLQYVAELIFRWSSDSPKHRLLDATRIRQTFGSSAGFEANRWETNLIWEWLDHLRELGAKRLWLTSAENRDKEPLHLDLAFAGANSAYILTETKEQNQLWRSSWQVDPEKRAKLFKTGTDKRIWTVSYHGTPTPIGSEAVTEDHIVEAQTELRKALLEAETYGRANSLQFFADWFLEALKLLDSPNPEPPFHPDLMPAEHFTVMARQLLAASVRAWVFGGMGSWNDVVISKEQQSQYDRITDKLFRSIMRGLVVSVNSELIPASAAI